ncbi:MAG: extracellular solute-binding protein [Lachnospiraceae bacterium]|nr:extracellular solute-binding protein [Lachnospiraceae bacterium]
MKKRTMALMMAAMMAASAMTGCGGSGAASSNAGSEGGKAAEGEQVTLKMHLHTNNKFTILDKDGNILPVYQLAAKQTGVVLENTANPVAQKSAEEFQLQATEKFPADIYGGANLKGPIFTYALQGAFIPMNDLIEEHAPNIKKYLEENPEIKKALTAPDGNIYMLNYVPDGEAGRAYFLRQDWLDKLGLSMPTTFEELETVLYAFRDGDPNGNGQKDEIPYFNDKFEEMIRLANLWGARVYSNDSFQDRIVVGENDKLYHAWTAPEFKEAIAGLNQWYEDGIIDPEIFTRKQNTSRQTLWTKDNVGGMTHEWIASTTSYCHNEELLKAVPDFKLGVMLPVNKNGKGFEEHQRAMMKPDGWAISSNCKNPEAAIRFMDWFYSEEGNRAANYGIEGETYDMVDGKPIFKPEVLKQGSVQTYLEQNYGAQLPIGFAQDFEYEKQWTSPEGLEAYNTYVNADIYTAPYTPILNLTAEETEVYDSYLTVLNEYQNERISAFITGKEDIETGWDSYVAKCQELGSEEIVKVYQAAYDRYLAQ